MSDFTTGGHEKPPTVLERQPFRRGEMWPSGVLVFPQQSCKVIIQHSADVRQVNMRFAGSTNNNQCSVSIIADEITLPLRACVWDA